MEVFRLSALQLRSPFFCNVALYQWVIGARYFMMTVVSSARSKVAHTFQLLCIKMPETNHPLT
jgi:hypothetical protein